MVCGQLADLSHKRQSTKKFAQSDKNTEDVLFKDLKTVIRRLAKCPFRNNLIGKLQNLSVNDQRDNAVSSLRCLNQFYNFSSQTFATAVQYLDFVLSKVKVQNKYLSCLAASCHYIATKIHEEPEDQPSATELSQIHRYIWKASDLKRMELVVLEKLNWTLMPITCPTILKHICDILRVKDSSLSETIFDDLLHRYEVCINYSDCIVYNVQSLALSLVQVYLKECDLLTPDITRCLLQLHVICDISDSELYECYETVTRILHNYSNNPKSHPNCLPLPKPQPRLNLITRPSVYGDTDLPTIHENPVTMIYVSTSDSDESPVIKKRYDSWSNCVIQGRSCVTAE